MIKNYIKITNYVSNFLLLFFKLDKILQEAYTILVYLIGIVV
jgi:hypothetical protein